MWHKAIYRGRAVFADTALVNGAYAVVEKRGDSWRAIAALSLDSVGRKAGKKQAEFCDQVLFISTDGKGRRALR